MQKTSKTDYVSVKDLKEGCVYDVIHIAIWEERWIKASCDCIR